MTDTPTSSDHAGTGWRSLFDAEQHPKMLRRQPKAPLAPETTIMPIYRWFLATAPAKVNTIRPFPSCGSVSGLVLWRWGGLIAWIGVLGPNGD